ncbi:hypothetical protein [Roseibium sp.]|uniref:hypothetical protein n=1 Tax=Roseibium sp. TaxID=1936156 RepID=UPI003A96F492
MPLSSGMDPRVKPEDDGGGEGRNVPISQPHLSITPHFSGQPTPSVMPWLDHGIHAVAPPLGDT